MMRGLPILFLLTILFAVGAGAMAQGERQPLQVDGEIVALSPAPNYSALALKVHSRIGGEDRYSVLIYDPKQACVTAHQQFQEQPHLCDWSPDSRILTIIDNDNNTSHGGRIVLLTPSGGASTIATTRGVGDLAWDGKSEGLYFRANNDIFRYDRAKRTVSRIGRKQHIIGIFTVKGQACVAVQDEVRHTPTITIRAIVSGKQVLTIPLDRDTMYDPYPYTCDLSPNGRYFHINQQHSAVTQDIIACVEDAPLVMKKLRYAICADSDNFGTSLSQLRWSPFPTQHMAISTNVVVNLDNGAYSAIPRHPFLASDRFITWWQAPTHFLVITDRGVEPRGSNIRLDDYPNIPVLIRHTPLKVGQE